MTKQIEQRKKDLLKYTILSYFLTILLFPIVLLQVIYILLTIPRLSGPKDASEGTIKNKNARKTIKFLIIGESSVSGDGLKTYKHIMGYKFIEKLSNLPEYKPFNIQWKIIGKSGITIQNLQKYYTPKINAKDWDIILLMDSGNDCFRMTSPASFKKANREVLLNWFNQNPDIDIYLPSPPNLFTVPGVPHPLREIFGIRSILISKVLGILAEEINSDLQKNKEKYTGKVIFSEWGRLTPKPGFFGIDNFHTSVTYYYYSNIDQLLFNFLQKQEIGSDQWADDELLDAQLPLKFRT